MLWGAHLGGLELRTEGGATRLRATFPYGRAAVLSDGRQSGRAKTETIEARAFADRIESGAEIHFLVSHDFSKPLASTTARTLTLTDTDTALTVEARIDPELAAVSYVQDFLRTLSAGLVRGLSPGFRVSPGGEAVEERDGALLRTIRAAELFEVSAVTRPAYPDAQIEARNWRPDNAEPGQLQKLETAFHHTRRWR